MRGPPPGRDLTSDGVAVPPVLSELSSAQDAVVGVRAKQPAPVSAGGGMPVLGWIEEVRGGRHPPIVGVDAA
jgi:hypothetical protein